MTIPSASKEVLVDSSGWLEYVTGDTKAGDFAPYIEAAEPILVPTIVIYEVYKKLLSGRGKIEADRFASQALGKRVVPLDEDLAFAAAEFSVAHRLAMADAVIFATAQKFRAKLLTSDPHFQGLPGVTVI